MILRQGNLVDKPAAFVIGIPVYFWYLSEIESFFVVEADSSGIGEELLKNSLRIPKPSQFFENSTNNSDKNSFKIVFADGFVF